MPSLPEFRNRTRVFNWLAIIHILHSCTILVCSIGHTGFQLHLGRFQHCNMCEFVWRTQVQFGRRGFYFPCCSILQRNFPNFGMEILAVRSAKKMLGFIFFLVLFSCSTYIVVQKLTKTYPRRIYTFCLFLFSNGM